jgi:hypothetical protein
MERGGDVFRDPWWSLAYIVVVGAHGAPRTDTAQRHMVLCRFRCRARSCDACRVGDAPGAEDRNRACTQVTGSSMSVPASPDGCGEDGLHPVGDAPTPAGSDTGRVPSRSEEAGGKPLVSGSPRDPRAARLRPRVATPVQSKHPVPHLSKRPAAILNRSSRPGRQIRTVPSGKRSRPRVASVTDVRAVPGDSAASRGEGGADAASARLQTVANSRSRGDRRRPEGQHQIRHTSLRRLRRPGDTDGPENPRIAPRTERMIPPPAGGGCSSSLSLNQSRSSPLSRKGVTTPNPSHFGRSIRQAGMQRPGAHHPKSVADLSSRPQIRRGTSSLTPNPSHSRPTPNLSHQTPNPS